jgi:hypothetical protein
MVHVSGEQKNELVDELMTIVRGMADGSSAVMALHIPLPSSTVKHALLKAELLKHISRTFGVSDQIDSSRLISGVLNGVAKYIDTSGPIILLDDSHFFAGRMGKIELATFVAACIAADKRLILVGEDNFTEIFTASNRVREMEIQPGLE